MGDKEQDKKTVCWTCRSEAEVGQIENTLGNLRNFRWQKHEAKYENVSFLLVDTFEPMDSDHIAALVECHVDFLVVVLLTEDADTLAVEPHVSWKLGHNSVSVERTFKYRLRTFSRVTPRVVGFPVKHLPRFLDTN